MSKYAFLSLVCRISSSKVWENEYSLVIFEQNTPPQRNFQSFQEPAVHEQKLNFLRAHLTELNRRMVALMETSEKGFPTHNNLQVFL